jgi:hypothetical protein
MPLILRGVKYVAFLGVCLVASQAAIACDERVLFTCSSSAAESEDGREEVPLPRARPRTTQVVKPARRLPPERLIQSHPNELTANLPSVKLHIAISESFERSAKFQSDLQARLRAHGEMLLMQRRFQHIITAPETRQAAR